MQQPFRSTSAQRTSHSQILKRMLSRPCLGMVVPGPAFTVTGTPAERYDRGDCWSLQYRMGSRSGQVRLKSIVLLLLQFSLED